MRPGACHSGPELLLNGLLTPLEQGSGTAHAMIATALSRYDARCLVKAAADR